jgi:hypothetical protein
MKTKEEIEQLAEKEYPYIDGSRKSDIEYTNNMRRLFCTIYTEGYTQCQEDMVDNSKVTRFEVIDENGRVYVKNSLYNCHLELSYQDDGKTLKVFIKSNKQD